MAGAKERLASGVTVQPFEERWDEANAQEVEARTLMYQRIARFFEAATVGIGLLIDEARKKVKP